MLAWASFGVCIEQELRTEGGWWQGGCKSSSKHRVEPNRLPTGRRAVLAQYALKDRAEVRKTHRKHLKATGKNYVINYNRRDAHRGRSFALARQHLHPYGWEDQKDHQYRGGHCRGPLAAECVRCMGPSAR